MASFESGPNPARTGAKFKDRAAAKLDGKEDADKKAEEALVKYAQQSGPLEDDSAGYLEFARKAGKEVKKDEDPLGYEAFAKGAGKEIPIEKDDEGYLEFARGAGKKADGAQNQNINESGDDQTAEEAALHRTETDRQRQGEGERGREATRAEEVRTAEHEAAEAEGDATAEEAALHRTETDRGRATEGARAEEATRAEEARAAEHEAQENAETREREEGERLERELTRLEDAYARAYGQAKARQGLLARTLGIRNVENDPAVQQAREAYAAARGAFNDFQIRGLEGQAGTISEQELRQRSANIAGEIFQNQDIRLQAKKNEQRELEDLQRGWFSRRVENGFNRAVQWYRNQKWYTKLLAAGGFALVGGWAAVAGMGAMRIIGGAAAGKGTQELLQHGADSYRGRRGAERARAARRIMEMGNLSAQERVRALQNIVGQHDQRLNQRFTRMERGDITRRHIGMLTGIVLGSGVAANYIRETIGDWWTGKGGGGAAMPEAAPKSYNPGGPPMVEGSHGVAAVPETGKMTFGLYDADGNLTPEGNEYFKQYNIEPFDSPPKGPSVIDQAANSPAAGAEVSHPEFEVDSESSAVIEKGGNIWATTRDLYMDDPHKFGYNPDDPKIGKLFNSFKGQGILDKLGIDADNFGDLSDEDKLKIWAENRTANSVNKLAQLQGGRVRDLVHPGDSILLAPDGTIQFFPESGIKAGYLSDIQHGGHGGGGAYETGGGRGVGATGLEEYDRQIEEARGRGQAAQKVLDENMRYRREVLNPEYAAAGAQEGAMMNLRSNYALLDKMMDDSMGGGFNLSDKVEDVARNARSFATLPGGEMPETLTAQDLDLRSKSANLFNDLFRRFPYQPGQKMDDYLSKISNTDMLRLRKLYNL